MNQSKLIKPHNFKLNFPSLTRAQHGVHMKNYNYSYDPYNPNKHIEGFFWKAQGQWKKNRPTCGAKCRDAHLCKAKVVINQKTGAPINSRCRMHGGLSCGPKTLEGKARSRDAAKEGMLKYWQKKKSKIS